MHRGLVFVFGVHHEKVDSVFIDQAAKLGKTAPNGYDLLYADRRTMIDDLLLAGTDVIARLLEHLGEDTLARRVGINGVDLRYGVYESTEASLVLHMCQPQGAAIVGEPCCVIDQRVITGQVGGYRHDDVGTLERVTVRTHDLWVREHQYGAGHDLRQNIEVLAQTVRPAPGFTM